MPRFYYEHEELEDGQFIYVVYGRGRWGEIARCERGDVAENIVAALNAYKPPTVGVFG